MKRPDWIMLAWRPVASGEILSSKPRAPHINASGTRTDGLYDQDRRRTRTIMK